MHITIVAGARPNFIKIAPIIHAVENAQLGGANLQYSLVHTGQHFDEHMSATFFRELNIPEPDINLECNGGSQAELTATIMVKFEHYLKQYPTNLVLVVGDVTSTMACAITAQKLNIKVAHIEAGIRSGDWSMPEEINRLVTDSITNYFFTTSEYANTNLLNSGVKQEFIFFVGNTMIDTLLKNIPRLSPPELYHIHNLKETPYIVLTLHRPSNVDNKEKLLNILDVLSAGKGTVKIIFPVHPRTRTILEDEKHRYPDIIFCEPMSYLRFNYLVKNALAVVTDSGGITEETTVLGIPCITLRNTTERPETCIVGTNMLIGDDTEKLLKSLHSIQMGQWKKGTIPELWDGKTAERIVSHILNLSF